MKNRIITFFLILTFGSLSIFTARATNPPAYLPPAPGEDEILESYDETWMPDPEEKDNEEECPCPGSVKPGSISMEIPFGTPLHRGNIPKGIITLDKEKMSPSLYTPQSLKFNFIFDSSITCIKTSGLPAGIVREVQIKRASDNDVAYQFKTGESIGYPTGYNVSMSIPMRMIDSNGNPVTDNPAYYERLFPNGSRVRYQTQQNSYVYSIIAPDGNEFTSSSVGIETIYDSNKVLRQIYSAVDGLADFVGVSEREYEIRLYSPENAGSKNVQGIYVPQNNPFEVWRIGIPSKVNQDGTLMFPNNITISQATIFFGSNFHHDYAYDWEYIEATNAWTRRWRRFWNR